MLGRGVSVTCSQRFTSGVIPADLLVASMAAELSLPHTCKALVGLETELSCCRSQCEIRQTLYQLSYPGSANIKNTLKNIGKWKKYLKNGKKYWKSQGKVREFCQSAKVRTMKRCMMSLPVWLPGPMFLPGVPVSGPMFLPGVLFRGSLSRGSTLDRNPP